MAFESAVADEVETLSEREREALVDAASWYFQYHGRIIAEQADDRSLVAVTHRDRFYDLRAALSKLGIRLALPDGLPPR